ncbi:hypothetical protein [Longimicrobium sp.]|uniref:hypothetical protein n=1 Tax=Longimicrobium sp. TaxID=2029185 RepID=UPI002E30A96B|nr:hypothetical protein [Longimicrobium sp.]HEX6039270.1 hypothetical protein [Longimicrobium sp.]
MKNAILLALAAMSVAAAPAAAQTIAQGMTPAQVQSEFGAPATTRDAGDWTYWYYHNGCPRRCGSDDVVFFQNDRVVAAVLRTNRRHYRGPQADDALQAADDGTSGVRVNAAPGAGEPARVGGVRVESEPAGTMVIPPQGTPVEGTPVPAREGRPGEPSTIRIENTDGTAPAPTTVIRAEPVDGNGATAAPAENTEATDTQGQTSIDRKNQRNERDRTRQPTATERARQNDRRGNP